MKKVKMYGLSTCPWCRKTKQFLAENKIQCEIVDYDLASEEEQEKIQKEIMKYGGTGGFPFVIIEGEAVQGYNPEKYKKLLGISQ